MKTTRTRLPKLPGEEQVSATSAEERAFWDAAAQTALRAIDPRITINDRANIAAATADLMLAERRKRFGRV